MSHRRKAKDLSKQESDVMDFECVNEDVPSHGSFKELVEKAVNHHMDIAERCYRCQLCGGHECMSFPDEYGAISLECVICGHPVPVVMPVYAGMGHDILLGYLIEYLGEDGKKVKAYVGSPKIMRA